MVFLNRALSFKKEDKKLDPGICMHAKQIFIPKLSPNLLKANVLYKLPLLQLPLFLNRRPS